MRLKWRDSFLWRPRPWYSKRKYPEGHVCLERCTVNLVWHQMWPPSFSVLVRLFLPVLMETSPFTCMQTEHVLTFIPIQCLKRLFNMLTLNAMDIVCCKTRPRYFEYGIQMWSPPIIRHFFHLLAPLYKQILLNSTIFS